MTDENTAPFVGVVMLNTHFPRLVGDIGNPASFPMPVRYRTVERATVGRVVRDTPLDEPLQDALVAAAVQLERDGAGLIATSCGFLGGLQARLAAAVDVPVLASALALMPLLRGVFGHEAPIGVLTFDAERLSPHHFGADGAIGPVAIAGLDPASRLYRVIADDLPAFDYADGEAATIAATHRLLVPEPAAILLECTNLAPYASAIRRVSGRPVFHIVDAVTWMWRAANGEGSSYQGAVGQRVR